MNGTIFIEIARLTDIIYTAKNEADALFQQFRLSDIIIVSLYLLYYTI